MKNPELNFDALFDDVVLRGREEGVTTQEGFRELVEDVVATQADIGAMGDDTSSADVTEQLVGRFPEYQESLGVTTAEEEADL